MSKPKITIVHPKPRDNHHRSMFGAPGAGDKLVKESVAELDNGGYPVSLSLIISRLNRNHPELGLKENHEKNTVKQAVFKLVRKNDIKLTGPDSW